MQATDTTEIRANLHGMWSSVAPAWAENADFTDSRSADLTTRLLDRASIGSGDRVLELACGAGGLGLAAAERVAPGGEVVLSDVAPEMVDIAGERARSRGFENVGTCVLDLEQIDQPDESYDAALCREGLMFALDPGRALREIHRVLKPGGRIALAVWGPRDRNPWLGIVLDSVSAQIGSPVPPPGIPGPFALEDSSRLGSLLSDAGFAAVEIGEVAVPTEAPSFDEWWSRTCSLAGPISKLLGSLPADAQDELRGRARDRARPYETAGGVSFPGVTLVASGERA